METMDNLQGLAPFVGRVVRCQQRGIGGHVRLEPSSFHLLKDVPCLLPLLTCENTPQVCVQSNNSNKVNVFVGATLNMSLRGRFSTRAGELC